MSSTTDRPPPRDPSPLRLLPDSGASGGSLPRWLTSFVGREREIADVQALVERGDIRLLTLTGTAGVGKTRLAVRVAESARAFAEGTWFVPLAAIRDPALVVPAVANRLGVPAGQSNTAAIELARFIGPRRCLLVLDNLEQVADAAVPIVELLHDCPNLTVMATSRVPLNVSGEHVYLVHPLPLPAADPAASLDQVAANDTVALFVARSQARSTGFALTADNVGAVAEICHRLDGLPLAIELAASRVAVLPVPVLLERLDHRLAVLTGGPRDAPDRLRSLGSAIAWSHDLLDERERTLFRRLGVFANGFTLEAADAIAGFDLDLLASLDALLASNLVAVRSTESGEPRYLLLETIREYAADQLAASAENDDIRRRHARWFMAMAEDAIPYYDGPRAWEYVRKVEAEIDNCRAALAWCVARDEAETGIRLAGALWRIWRAHLAAHWSDQFGEARQWLERVLTGREGLPLASVAEALHGISEFAYALGAKDEAERWATELLTRSEADDYPYGIRWSSDTLFRIALDKGDVALARMWAERAVAVSPHVRDPENHTGIALYELAVLERRVGNRDAAVAHWQAAADLFRACGNAFYLSDALINIGANLAYRLSDSPTPHGNDKDRLDAGDFDGALGRLADAIAICAGNGDDGHMDSALYHAARIALDAGRPVIAARLLAASPPQHDRYPGFGRDFRTLRGEIEQRVGEDAFGQHWEDGRRLSWDDVAAEIAHLQAAVRERAATDAEPGAASRFGLTPRELDVLRLLTDGESNRAIADALSISERTVEGHVLHILTKLGLGSRSAAAAWAVRNGLA